MTQFRSKLSSFFSNRWLVFVAAMWVQSCAGVGYLFGSISPSIKASFNYNQRQVAALAVAKDLGDSIGFLAGALSEAAPLWVAMMVGAIQNFVGYGWVWLAVSGRVPAPPLWVMCVLIFVGNNGETYFNTSALVSCVQNFPKSRGPVVGILKGFAGLSGAILTQLYATIHTRPADDANGTLILMVAVGPTLVVLGFMFLVRPVGGHRQAYLMVAVGSTLVVSGLMFLVRPVGGHRQVRSTDNSSFIFIYSVCILLAAYLMCVMLLEDLVDLSHTTIVIFTVVLLIFLLLPVAIPVILTLFTGELENAHEPLLAESGKMEAGNSGSKEAEQQELILSEVEDEKPKEVDLLPASERQRRIAQLQAKLFQAAAVGAVKRRRGPRRGEDFTLMQALVKADFWLLFFSLLLGSGSGLTVIDNLGQMSQSLGYDETHIFVSMISIWNFLGRIAGGYFSEIVARDYAYPRPIALATAQVIMAVGHFFFAMAWPGTMYVGTLLIGLGYGAHWAIVPAAASELFGLKFFGALYNFLTIANPAGSLVFSGVIASGIYDYEAGRQKSNHGLLNPNRGLLNRGLGLGLGLGLGAEESLKCEGAICFFASSLIMAGFCVVAVILSLVLVHRTKVVYRNLYGNPQ